jgi:hypothetical protein
MNFIKKIFDGENADEEMHLQFQKFSKGEFRDRALIYIKKMGKAYNIKTSAEFGNELVRLVADKVGSEKVRVKGAIVSTQDFTGVLNFKDKKQFQGVKRYIIDTEMSGNEIIKLLDEIPKAFFGLTFDSSDGNYKLKIKPKAPKSGKPGKGDEEPKADFCVLKTNDEEIMRSFVFEKKDFIEAQIKHTYFIEKIVIPSELMDGKDFALIREKSERHGRIVRDAIIDGEKIQSEREFKA